jgi:hypothetical protein
MLSLTLIDKISGVDTTMENSLENHMSDMMYTPSSCFICAKHIPNCLISRHGYLGNMVYAVCIITIMQHTICVYNHGANQYSLFDPLGSIWLQYMTHQEITSRLETLCKHVVQADATIIYNTR